MNSTDDDWEDLKDTQYDPIPEPQEHPKIKKGGLYFLTWGAALIIFIGLQFLYHGPRVLDALVGGLVGIPFFPVGLGAPFAEYLPSWLVMPVLCGGWLFYFLHAFALARACDKIRVRNLLILLAVVLLLNVYGCSKILQTL